MLGAGWPEFWNAVEAGHARVVVDEPDRMVLQVPDWLLFGEGEESRREMVRSTLQTIVKLPDRGLRELGHLLILLPKPVDRGIWIHDRRSGVESTSSDETDAVDNLARTIGTGVPTILIESPRCRCFTRAELEHGPAGCSLAIEWLSAPYPALWG